MTSLNEELVQATKVPQVAYWAQLVAQLKMDGLKIVPEDQWDKLGEWLHKAFWGLGEPEIREYVEAAGFKMYENHTRRMNHEAWQYDFKDSDSWFIPVDELVILFTDNAASIDFISICRLTFDGSEEDLKKAIDKLVTIPIPEF